jgi:hypothetical protein
MIPLTPTGNPQPPQVKDKDTAQKAQWGEDVRPEPLRGTRVAAATNGRTASTRQPTLSKRLNSIF